MRFWYQIRSDQSLSRVWLFATPWTVAYQAPPSMVFFRQECWIGLPFPSPGDLPDSGIEPGSPALQADVLPSQNQGSKEKLKSHLMKVKEESEKVGLKLNIQMIIASWAAWFVTVEVHAYCLIAWFVSAQLFEYCLLMSLFGRHLPGTSPNWSRVFEGEMA